MLILPGCRNLSKLIVVLALLLGANAACAQTTTFTYQGRLTDNGTAADGNYDCQFALFDASGGGAQIGAPLTRTNVVVANGVFTVQLDFGAGAFPGANRFLEIGVRITGGGSFTTLSPRQQITAASYGIRTLSAASADTATNATQLGGVAASQYVLSSDARLSDPRPPTAGSSNYVQNTASQQASSNFNISGNGTAAGTLTGNIVNATTQYNIGGERMFSAPGAQNLFAGYGAGPLNTGSNNAFFGHAAGDFNGSGSNNSYFGASAGFTNTSGFNNAFFGHTAGFVSTASYNSFFGYAAGQANTAGGDNTFFGALAGIANTSGSRNTVIGRNANVASGALTNATAIGAFARVDQNDSLVLGSVNGVNGATADTKVGIGTTAPAAKLDIKGSSATDVALQISNGAIKVAGAGLGTSTPVFIHRATAGNIACATPASSCTTIDHPLTNGDPNAILIVTPNWNPGGLGGTYNNHPIGVYYEDFAAVKKWRIFNQDLVAMPVNAAFNVLVVKP
ncbi:MAG: hypothetical protein ABI831_13620 [Betaproteobacteria bacterium]